MNSLLAGIVCALFCLSSARGQDLQFWRVLSSTTSQLVSIEFDGNLSWSNSSSEGLALVQRASSLDPEDWSDFRFIQSTGGVLSVNIFGPGIPTNMALISAGEFAMGDARGDSTWPGETPVRMIYTKAYFIDKFEVTLGLWYAVIESGGDNGYIYSNPGSGKGAEHPVQTVNWHDAIKWCNARSEMEGLIPVYYTDSEFTTVYRQGEITPHADWSANGYRLPTEAEWEKAARGGLVNMRFAWGDTISHEQANYYSGSSYHYDMSGNSGYHPAFSSGGEPYTSPVGSFAPNGYGLYDVMGNVYEWCWDWYDAGYYSASPYKDPTGPSSGDYKVLRGGSWIFVSALARVAARFYYYKPHVKYNFIGFRCVRNL